MRDPHVAALYYEVKGEAGISYQNPLPLSFSNQLGRFILRDKTLTVEPAEHYGGADDARTAIDLFIRSWQIAVDLTDGIGTIRFTFKSAEIIDRNPPPPNTAQVLCPNVTENGVRERCELY